MASVIRVLLVVSLLWVTVSIATETESDNLNEQDDAFEIEIRSKRGLRERWQRRRRMRQRIVNGDESNGVDPSGDVDNGGWRWRGQGAGSSDEWHMRRAGRGQGRGMRRQRMRWRIRGPENAGDGSEGEPGQGSEFEGSSRAGFRDRVRPWRRRHQRPDMAAGQGEGDADQGLHAAGSSRPGFHGPRRPGRGRGGGRNAGRMQVRMERFQQRIAARLADGEIVLTEMSGRAQRMINVLSTAVNTFTSRIFPQLKQRSEMVYSPYGIYKVLSMSFIGARGITAFQMKRILSLQGLGRLCHRAHKKVDILLMSVPYVSYPTTILFDKGVDLTPVISSKIGLFYNENITAIDIGDPDGAEIDVNDWIAEETNDGITSILSADTLDEADSITLVNGMYFKAKWMTAFPAEETSEQMFKKSASDEIPVQMMQVESMFRMGQIPGQEGRFLEVPFQGDRFSMVIYLPDAIDGLPAIEDALTHELISIQLTTILATSVRLELPKFTLETAWTLKNQLQGLGLNKPFIPDTADFSFFSNSTSLHINDVVHKAVVEIDEDGEVAAESTGESTTTFRCDRPFLFVIRHSSSKIPFLVGKFAGGV